MTGEDIGDLEESPTEGSAAPTGRRLTSTVLPVAAWAVLIVAPWAWGTRINAATGGRMLVDAPPLTGVFRVLITPWVLAPIGVAIAGVWVGPRLARSLPWRRLLIAATAGAALWAIALALARGPGWVLRPVENQLDYLAAVSGVGSPGEFLETFTERIASYPSHVRSHPPGMVLLLWGVGKAGLGGAGWAGALDIIGGVLAVPAVLLAVRDLANEVNVRAVAPFLMLAPGALWVATSADALYTGVAAWAVALIVLATGREGRRSVLLAAAGGLLLGIGLFLSYGLVLIALIPIAVAWGRRTWRPLAIAAGGVAVVVVVFSEAGFWWVDGLLATREQYVLGIARYRPYVYFLVANLAALAIAVGPATAAGLARLRDRRLWLLVGPALAAVALADISGLSKAEVERIWLPFVVWLLVACAPLARSPRARVWLGSQAALALAVQVGVRTPW